MKETKLDDQSRELYKNKFLPNAQHIKENEQKKFEQLVNSRDELKNTNDGAGKLLLDVYDKQIELAKQHIETLEKTIDRIEQAIETGVYIED